MCVGTHLLVKSSEQKKKKPRKFFTASRSRLKIQDSRHDAGSLFTASLQTRRRLTLEGLTQGSAVRVGWGREGGGWKTKCKLCLLERMSTSVKGGRLAGETACQHFPIQTHRRWEGGVDGGGGGHGVDAVCLSVCDWHLALDDGGGEGGGPEWQTGPERVFIYFAARNDEIPISSCARKHRV